MTPVRVPRALVRETGVAPDVLRAFRAAVSRYASKRWVTGVTISLKETGQALHPDAGLVIAIHVIKKRPRARLPKGRRIPSKILGIRTDVVEGEYRPCAGPVAIPVPVTLPLEMGMSISRLVNGSAASIGGLVRDDAGTRYVLCAGHTLREGGAFKKGDPLVHPGQLDVLAPGQHVVVGRYEKVHLGVDAGLVRLDAASPAMSNRTKGTGHRVGPPSYPRPGDCVRKSGRTTGSTTAIVQGVGTLSGYSMALHLRPANPAAGLAFDAGDSGAVWYDDVSHGARGLHIGVSQTPPYYGVASAVAYITQRWMLTWV